MGLYVNPDHCSKEEWLRTIPLEHRITSGTRSTLVRLLGSDKKHWDKLYRKVREDYGIPIVLIHNNSFNALSVMRDGEELKALLDNTKDHRLMVLFVIHQDSVIDLIPDVLEQMD